jgi:RNA polymerase sigma factor (sigma-70 family)
MYYAPLHLLWRPVHFAESPWLPGGAREEEDWDSLMTLTAEGYQAAFSTRYDRSSPRVYGLALRILGDHAAAEEVMLDVFLQVWRKASGFDPSRGSAVAWLLTIARSRAIDRLRAGQVERHRTDLVDSPDSFADLADERQDPEMITVLKSENAWFGKLFRGSAMRSVNPFCSPISTACAISRSRPG